MVVPVPPDLKSFRRVIPKEAMKSLKQGISSREDLLLLLGSPDQRREQDRYFIYEWAFSLAFVAVGVPYAADGDVVNQYNFFCVEFDKDNRIKRHAHIKGDGIKAQYEVDEWMSESY
jgi:hypothetical protein